MKKIQPTLHDKTNLNASIGADKRAVVQTFKLGLDVDLKNIVVAVQCGNGAIPPAQKFSRARLVAWVKEKMGPDTRCTRCMKAAALVIRCTRNWWRREPTPW